MITRRWQNRFLEQDNKATTVSIAVQTHNEDFVAIALERLLQNEELSDKDMAIADLKSSVDCYEAINRNVGQKRDQSAKEGSIVQVNEVDNNANTKKLKQKLQRERQRRMLRRRITTGLEVAHNEYYSCTGGIDGSLPTQEDDPYTPT